MKKKPDGPASTVTTSDHDQVHNTQTVLQLLAMTHSQEPRFNKPLPSWPSHSSFRHLKPLRSMVLLLLQLQQLPLLVLLIS